MSNLIECHANEIVGVLACFDRLVIQGTLPSICHPKAMATELDRRGIRLFDYAQFARRHAGAPRRGTSTPGRPSTDRGMRLRVEG